jgi:hypothetical protein
MRAAFGLVSLLVVVAIILILFSMYSIPAAKQGRVAQNQARQIAGLDEDNAPVTDAVTLDAKDRNGKMEGAVVTSITPGSALQKRFGLQNGDVILEMGPLSVKENMSSASEAKDFLLDAYQKDQSLVVMRGSERFTLPQDMARAAAAAARAPAPGANPNPETPQASAQQPDPATENKPEQKKPAGGLQGQLDLIRNIPGQ